MDVTMAEPGEILPERKIDNSVYDLLKNSKLSVEDIVAKMLAIKKDGHSKSNLRELVTHMFLNFVSLRQANRSILIQEDHVKQDTEHAKAPVDFTTLQLQNLMYEKSHYVKAIKACKDFKSKYPDIELVPEEEFFRDAPEDIKNSVISKDSAHNLMLKRLNFELFQRKELCKLHEKLEREKKVLIETIANRKKFLSSLPSHLKSLKKASLPIQNQLGVLHTKKLKQKHLAELLPPPLYVINSQFVAQKEAFGEKIDLEIIGSVKDAHTFARQQANKDSGISTIVENSKLDDDAPDEEDDGQRRRKRPKKVPGKESLDPAGIYQAHPLKIVLHIYDDEASDSNPVKLITLKFEYLLKLNVVCVVIEGSNEGAKDNILCNLFPDDTGVELPHQSAKLCHGNAVIFDEKRASRPYKWAQHLAGIDFLPEVSPLLSGNEVPISDAAKHSAITSGLAVYRQQNRIETVVQRIRARKKAQLALVEQLDLLSNLTWPAVTCKSVPWALHTPVCSLHSWSHVGSLHNVASPLTVTESDQVKVPTDVDMDRRTDTSKEEVENVREDGELPSLIIAASIENDVNSTPSKGSDHENTRRLSLISKSVVSPISMGKSLSFRKNDEDLDLMLDSGSELDEPEQEEETESTTRIEEVEVVDYSWIECGVQEYHLVLNRKLDISNRNMKLQAKVKIFVEYPLRPPLFSLSLSVAPLGENHMEANDSEWYNELRAMEAEVNTHIIKMVPLDEEKCILGHQVCFLAMLFDFYMDEGDGSLKTRNSTSVVDVGLCRPVNGKLIARNFRGRDRRRMISWKNNCCTSGYPC